MKLINKIFICCFMLTFGVVSDVLCDTSKNLPTCLQGVGEDESVFLTPLKKLINNKKLNQELINSDTAAFWNWAKEVIRQKCYVNPPKNALTNINIIADMDSIVIPFKIDNQKYEIEIKTDTLFEYFRLPTAIVVIDRNNLSPGDTISKYSFNDYFFPNKCSTNTPYLGNPDDAPVKRAGKNAFGSGSSYILDQPYDKKCRAFPGVVIRQFANGTSWSDVTDSSEQVVVYKNYRKGRQAMKKFAEGLQNSACSGNGLAVYNVDWDFNIPPKIAIPGFMGSYSEGLLEDVSGFTILSTPEVIR